MERWEIAAVWVVAAVYTAAVVAVLAACTALLGDTIGGIVGLVCSVGPLIGWSIWFVGR